MNEVSDNRQLIDDVAKDYNLCVAWTIASFTFCCISIGWGSMLINDALSGTNILFLSYSDALLIVGFVFVTMGLLGLSVPAFFLTMAVNSSNRLRSARNAKAL